MASARIRQARPVVAMLRPPSSRPLTLRLLLLVGEIRLALGDERVALADEHAALLANGHDDLPALAEGIGHGADVAHGDRHGPVAVAHPERLAAGDVRT